MLTNEDIGILREEIGTLRIAHEEHESEARRAHVISWANAIDAALKVLDSTVASLERTIVAGLSETAKVSAPESLKAVNAQTRLHGLVSAWGEDLCRARASEAPGPEHASLAESWDRVVRATDELINPDVVTLRDALIERGHTDECYSGEFDECDCPLAVISTSPLWDTAAAQRKRERVIAFRLAALVFPNDGPWDGPQLVDVAITYAIDEIKRLRGNVTHADAETDVVEGGSLGPGDFDCVEYLNTTPTGACRRVTETAGGESLTFEDDRRLPSASEEGTSELAKLEASVQKMLNGNFGAGKFLIGGMEVYVADPRYTTAVSGGINVTTSQAPRTGG